MQKRAILIAIFYLLLCRITGFGQSASTMGAGLHLTGHHETGGPASAPIVHPPVFDDDRSNILFSWAEAVVPDGCSVEHTISLFCEAKTGVQPLDGTPVFTARTAGQQFLFTDYLPLLEPGKGYWAVVHTLLQHERYSEVLDGWANAVRFEYVPVCTPPKKVEVASAGNDRLEIRWDGPNATPGGIQYLVRYRPMAQDADWQEILVEEGASVRLRNLDNQLEYEVAVQKICPGNKAELALASSWASRQHIALPSAKNFSLPPFDCGAAFTQPVCTGPYMPASEILQQDSLFIGGFPILIEELFQSSNSTEIVYGTGWVPLPFGDQVVKVQIGNPSSILQVNTQGKICSGIVRGIDDDPAYFPNLDPGPVPFGGEICLPPPSAPAFDENGIHNVTGLPWDENGFGPDSLYAKEPPYPGYVPGNLIDTTGQYDPWGFDSQGNHVNGGTTNENGCTQEQMQEPEQTPPCVAEPYYWLDQTDTPPTQAGNALANDVADSLAIWLNQILTDLETQLDDSISTKGTTCGGIRQDMNDLVGNLGYDRQYLFGPADEYINEGMHKRFTEKPKPLQAILDRNPDQENLEAKHILLYECDKALQVFKDLQDIYAELRQSGLTDLADELKERIKRFSAEDAAKFTNRDSLYAWLTQQVKDKGADLYKEEHGLGFYQNLPDGGTESLALRAGQDRRAQAARPFPQTNGTGNFLASGGPGDDLPFLESLDLTPDDVLFQFKQGWQEVNGLNRAHYLEAIGNARNRGFLFPNMLTEHDSTLQPIIVANRASDGRLYRVYLDNIVFTPTAATLDAYLLLEIPNTGQKVAFQALQVGFTPYGAPTIPIKLSLASDVSMRLNNAAKLTFVASQNTFVAVNCGGFAGIGIEAELEICRDKVLPLDRTTLDVLPEPERVSANFQVFMPTWSDLYVQISIDPFAVNGLEDFKWQVDSITFDFSDVKSPAGMPPAGYQSALAGPGGFTKQWKGFYMANLSVTMPNQWSSGSNPVTIAAQDIVVDNMGFSGNVSATNLLSLSVGNAGGWAFSIDQFELTVIANTPEKIALNGLINVPIISSANACGGSGPATAADCFPYSAFLEVGGNFHFDITMPQTGFCVDMWKAGTVVIDNCSSIQMQLANGDFDIVATLSGSVIINGDIGAGLSFNIPEISFQNVQVGNKDPYFSPGTWQFPNDLGVDFGGFALSVNDLKMVQVDSGHPALSFGATIEISEAANLSASGGFLVVGEMVTNNGRQRWKLKEVEVKGICIEGSFPGVESISGCINFFKADENPAYGSGFQGGVNVKFSKIEGAVQAVAQFGKMPQGYKYFFVDALFCGSINMGPVSLEGLGGGVYHHMFRPVTGAGLPLCAGNPTTPPIGSSLSGINYTPDATKGLGLKLTVVMALGNKRAFNANATLEVLFNNANSPNGSGLSDIWLYGNGRMMADLDMSAPPTHSTSEPPANNAPLRCNVDLHMNFNTNVFHGKLDVYLTTPALSGAGTGGLLGQAEVHLAPGNWYIKMGTPSNRLGMVASIPGFGNIAEFKTYLQLGMNLDPMPPLPDYIANLTGLHGSIAPARQGSFMEGNGFVFGAAMRLGGNEYNFAIFEAKLAVDLGFDVSILDYGPNAYCSNTNQALGINGWYASGQVYAGLGIGVKIKVKVFGKTKRFNIFDVVGAAALQAQLPNPFYARGGVGMEYDVLGGLVKGKCDFQFEIGERCVLQGAGDPYEIVPVIQYITPADSTNNVPVDIEPVVTFNFPVQQTFSMPDFDGNEASYHIKIDEVKITYREWDVPLSWWNFRAGNREMVIKPRIFLPRFDTFQVFVKLHVDSSGINVHQEEKTVTFITGPGRTDISPQNVAGSHPLNGQYNFYKKETTDGKGYIQLEKGQPDLFFDDPQRYLAVRFRQAGGGGCIVRDATYEFFQNKVVFNLPLDFLQADEMYKMELVSIPNSVPGYTVDPCSPVPPPSNAGAHSSSQQGYGESDGPSGKPTPPPPPAEKKLYSAVFRVSQYNKLHDKLVAWEASAVTGGVPRLWASSPVEPFDKFELGLEPGSEPSIKLTALTDQTPWWNAPGSAQRYMYDNLEPVGLKRDVAVHGFPPLNGLATFTNIGYNGLNASLPTVEVTEANFQSNSLPGQYEDMGSQLRNNLLMVVSADNTDFRNMAYANLYYDVLTIADAVEDTCPPIETEGMTPFEMYESCPAAFAAYGSDALYIYYFTKEFSLPAGGSFPVLVQYRLPGTNTHSTQRVIDLDH